MTSHTKKGDLKKAGVFERFAAFITRMTGSTPAFIVALLLVVVWGATGPLFHFSETWQLVINTGTTIITFLMVFLIQKTQNKDSLAIQLKLNELIAAHESASNRLVCVETMTEEEMKTIQKYYTHLSKFSQTEESLQKTHSIDEAERSAEFKKELNEERKRPAKAAR